MSVTITPSYGAGIFRHLDPIILVKHRRKDQSVVDLAAGVVVTPVGVALSGGGYRATLLAIGALTALVDRGVNRRVEIISSVSGGSITNAVVAQSGDFQSLTPGDLDPCATKLVHAVRHHSVLPVIATVVSSIAVPLLLFGWVFFPDNRLLGVVVGLAVASVFVALEGRRMRQGLTAQFELKSTLGDLADHATIHTFCSTDLVTGLPLTFSSPGLVRRRMPAGKDGDRVVVVEEPRWRLAAVVQASAAFPGISPMRVKFPVEPEATNRTAWCGDGGIWNNLGIQGIEGEPRVGELSVLCVNASARAKPMRPGWSFVPGISAIAAVVRSVNILNLNTVAPRIETIDRDVSRWADNCAAGGPPGPVTIVADMRRVVEAVELLRALPVDVGVQELVETPWWSDLTAADGPGHIRTKTKLSRVSKKQALALLLRGYANTWLASLAIQPFHTSELENERVRDINVRFEAILTGT